jgi:hypothetical protein
MASQKVELCRADINASALVGSRIQSGSSPGANTPDYGKSRVHGRVFRIFSVRLGNGRREHIEPIDLIGTPKGNRTPVSAVKGRCPGPLDDGR